MNILENCISDGMNDPEYYDLTGKAKRVVHRSSSDR